MKITHSYSTKKPTSHNVIPSHEIDSGERLQKALARIGLGSRREIETWIRQGAVTLEGRTAQLGDRYHSGQRVTFRGKVVYLLEKKAVPTRVLLYHKPIGEVVSRHDPEGRPTVFTQLPHPRQGRWITVGRLDITTQGLLLVTTNGELANRLMHPSQKIEREYAVRVRGKVEKSVLERLLQGVTLDDGPAHFETIREAGGEGTNRWFHVTLREGRNRIVRRLWESQGIVVSRLMRVRFGELELPPRLRAGKVMELEPDQVTALMNSVNLASDSDETPPPPTVKDKSPAKHLAKRYPR